jgi:hypothetical protein
MLSLNSGTQNPSQLKLIVAIQNGDEKTVSELIKNADIVQKNDQKLTPLQVLAQQAVPVEDTWLQLKYIRLTSPILTAPSVAEKQALTKLRSYLNIARILLNQGASKKGLESWDRRWYDDYEGQWLPNRYPLNSAKFGVDQAETADKKRFVNEQNQLAYFYNTNEIRLKE